MLWTIFNIYSPVNNFFYSQNSKNALTFGRTAVMT
jgi:hypothetical protein